MRLRARARRRTVLVVILRATGRALRFLPPISSPGGSSDNALGDWYVNRITVGRRPLLLLVNSRSLLPILEPAKDVRRFPDRLPHVVKRRLLEMGVAEGDMLRLEFHKDRDPADPLMLSGVLEVFSHDGRSRVYRVRKAPEMATNG